MEEHGFSESRITNKKKPGGWRAMPYILGTEAVEKLGTNGLTANFMVYLLREYHLDQVKASNVIYLWSGVNHFAPLLGAFIADSHWGRFKTIVFASFASLLGMVAITLTAGLHQLRPPPCQPQELTLGHCINPNHLQLGVLFMALAFLSIGSGGIKPCTIPFGVDQFDQTTEDGVKGVASFFNWYYMIVTVVLLLSLTVLVYIQDSVSWAFGFGIPTVMMAIGIVLFFAGTRVYVYVKPQGNMFSGIAQVVVAAYRKRGFKFLDEDDNHGVEFYDPPLQSSVLSKLPLTKQFRFLDKAAVISRNDLNSDGTPANKYRLTSIQQVEEVKCLIRIIPVWSAGIISLTAWTQQSTFIISQAMQMNRHLGSKFQMPPASIAVVSLLTVGIWLPFYDRVVVPSLGHFTRHKAGISLLQRIGIGNVFCVLAMVVAGLVERFRRDSFTAHGGSSISVFWLAPQLILLGFCEAFNLLGQIEFFNTQVPENMRSIGNSVFSLSVGLASYLSSAMVTTVHAVTGGNGRPDWLTNDINGGRLDHYYYLLAGIYFFNLLYFICCARVYQYKAAPDLARDGQAELGFLNVETKST